MDFWVKILVEDSCGTKCKVVEVYRGDSLRFKNEVGWRLERVQSAYNDTSAASGKLVKNITDSIKVFEAN